MIRKITQGLTQGLALGLTLALAATAAIAGDMININAAGMERLASGLDGVGEVRAQAIVDYRENNGRFASVAALTEVKGIGAATLEHNRDRLTVGKSE